MKFFADAAKATQRRRARLKQHVSLDFNAISFSFSDVTIPKICQRKVDESANLYCTAMYSEIKCFSRNQISDLFFYVVALDIPSLISKLIFLKAPSNTVVNFLFFVVYSLYIDRERTQASQVAKWK